jgi:redox-sensitive bicupin YhaK (pirin superfamily)
VEFHDLNPQAKRLERVRKNPNGHWVGDGFPVRTLFAYSDGGQDLSPFLLLDFGGPREFAPTEKRLGVGPHPHRGFETVTVVYQGEVEHRDSAGGGGQIGPGDVQWMTAARGLVHEEFHGRGFAARGGTFEMIQLWVNLPAASKGVPPRYQSLASQSIPTVALPNDAGTGRIIAGEYADLRGPAETHSPMLVLDMVLNAARTVRLSLPEHWTTLLVVLSGQAKTQSGEVIGAAEVGQFARSAKDLEFETTTATRALLLCGQPLAEPIAGSGPFVMNTEAEIRQAFADYRAGLLGSMD